MQLSVLFSGFFKKNGKLIRPTSQEDDSFTDPDYQAVYNQLDPSKMYSTSLTTDGNEVRILNFSKPVLFVDNKGWLFADGKKVLHGKKFLQLSLNSKLLLVANPTKAKDIIVCYGEPNAEKIQRVWLRFDEA